MTSLQSTTLFAPSENHPECIDSSHPRRVRPAASLVFEFVTAYRTGRKTVYGSTRGFGCQERIGREFSCVTKMCACRGARKDFGGAARFIRKQADLSRWRRRLRNLAQREIQSARTAARMDTLLTPTCELNRRTVFIRRP